MGMALRDLDRRAKDDFVAAEEVHAKTAKSNSLSLDTQAASHAFTLN
jgi:hypothetical protein